MNIITRKISYCVTRSASISINNYLPSINHSGISVKLQSDPQLQINCRSYSYHYPGEQKYDAEKSIEYEVSKNPEEWKYVNRLLPSNWIEEPIHKDSYPSGWTPPNPAALELPYYVCRTKNYMLPVYLKISQRGMRKLTVVRYIRGDIWLMYEELKKYVEDKCGKQIGVKVDEVGCRLILKGDHVYYTTEWIKQKGF